LRCCDFQSRHQPEDRDKLRFDQRDGKLRNLLHPAVPALAAAAVGHLWAARGPRPVAAVAVHPGGRDVLAALAPVLSPHSLAASARVLRAHGNMSSPSVLFALQEMLAADKAAWAAGDIWLASFGAGFSAHSCRVGRRQPPNLPTSQPGAAGTNTTTPAWSIQPSVERRRPRVENRS
jgi:alkylresorcinol/alkylpyrone synthase